MSKFSEFRSSLRNVTGRAAVEAELDEELHGYLEMLIAENIKAGATPDEARRRARMKVGGIERVKEEVRDVRPGIMIETIQRDLKHGFRLLKRSPGFAIIAIATIAIGIGATSAIFSVINAVALKPLPYPGAERLMFLTSTFPGLGFDKFWVSPPEFLELRERAKSYTDIAAYLTTAVNIADGTRPQRVPAIAMTASMFSVLDVRPRLGRAFTPEEDMPNRNPVAVISDNLWRNTYGSDASIVGRQVEISGTSRTIVGVAPPGFDLHDTHADVFVPLGLDPANRQNRGSHFLYVITRLKPTVSQEQGAAELKTLVHQWRSMSGNITTHVPNDSTPTMHNLQFVPLRDEVIGNVSKSLWVLQGAVMLVLLIACANVANLLLVRAEGRHKEFAIRTALGAGRSTILRQFMAEGLVLTFVGAVLGLAIAKWGLAALISANPTSLPRAAEIGIDPRVLIFTTIIAVLTATVFGLAPLFHLGRDAVAAAIKEGGTRSTASMTRQRMRQTLVAGEITLAVVLVIGAGLLIKSFHNLTVVDAGFDPQNVTTFSLFMPQAKYPEANRTAQFTQDLVRSLEQLQGVTSAAAITGLPPNRPVNANDTQFENMPTGPGLPAQNVDYWNISSVRYFEAMKIPIVAGRAFNTGDIGGAGAVVVNEALAKRFYPNTSALGHRLRPPGTDTAAPWFTIVGVAKDVKQGGLDQKVGTELYFNLEQTPRLQGYAPNGVTFVVRSARSTESLSNAIQTAVHAMDPALPVIQLKSMSAVFGDTVNRQRFLSLLLGIFAAVALLLAAIGTYGVLSYLVSERRREIGIRVALGASAGGIVKLVLRQGLSIAAVGIALGIGGALALGRVTQSMLFNISSSDPTTFVTVGFAILGVALLACIVPANRAMRVDPLVAIRNE